MLDLIDLAERRYVPDVLLREGIRWLLESTAARDARRDEAERAAAVAEFAQRLRAAPLAIATEAANEQHYEVPAEFYQLALGPRLKYSCCLWTGAAQSLAEAEEAMLDLTCRRAELRDGQRVLDLGCGWGALSLWIAERYPGCRVTAVSNSHSQRAHIERACRERGLDNVRVHTADIRRFDPRETFDRIVSVEMFEHLRNYELLFSRLAHWLRPGGKLLAHVFSYRHVPYEFETEGGVNWMGRHFFTGGLMPSDDLLPQFQRDLRLERQWPVSGRHYARTCDAWLAQLDARADEAHALFAREMFAHDDHQASLAVQRWRMFFMACAELFAFGGGDVWRVMHYRFARQADAPAPSATSSASDGA